MVTKYFVCIWIKNKYLGIKLNILKVIGDKDALFLLQNSSQELQELYKEVETIPKFISGLQDIFEKLHERNPGQDDDLSDLGHCTEVWT